MLFLEPLLASLMDKAMHIARTIFYPFQRGRGELLLTSPCIFLNLDLRGILITLFSSKHCFTSRMQMILSLI